MDRPHFYPRWLPGFMMLCVCVGIALRFLWLSDMEYKGDEQYMFDRSQAIGVSESWPWLGMPSGVGLRNPGMSIWVFVALAKIFSVHEPVSLAAAVVILNSLALLLLVYFSVWMLKGESQETWFWGIMLAAASPVAIQLQRKIWAQSTLPLFCVLFLFMWYRREKKMEAFLWGFFGAIVAQIHMSGIFFTVSVLVWTIWKELATTRKTSWIAWLLGSVFGSLTLIPWLIEVLSNLGSSSHAPWSEFFIFRYWGEWMMEGIGFSLRASLGRVAYNEFLKWPMILGYPTFLMAFLQIIAVFLGIFALIPALSQVAEFIREKQKLIKLIRGDSSETANLLASTVVGLGVFFSLARIMVQRHYLVVAYPFQHLWMSQLALLRKAQQARRLLIFLVIVELFTSLGFLSYVHFHGGARDGDYGVAYSAQTSH